LILITILKIYLTCTILRSRYALALQSPGKINIYTGQSCAKKASEASGSK
jgi:hypothetical protein